MKKIISLLVAASLVAFTGCAGGANTANTQNEAKTEQTEDLTGEISGEITVSAYESAAYKSFLEQAAASFEAANPGTKVNVSTFGAMPEAKTSESGGKKLVAMMLQKDEQAERDYINKINTELMSGGGADVLAMDILPWYKYAESGQLADINSLIEADSSFDMNDYRQNILQATQYNGGQYIFPLDYSFNYFAFDSSLFTDEQQASIKNGPLDYKELITKGAEPFTAANESADEPIYMFGTNPQTLFNMMYNANYGSFVDVEAKKASFDNGEFARLLEAVKAYESEGYIKPGAVNEKGKMDLQSFEKMNLEQFLYKSKSSMSLLQHFNNSSNRVMMFAGGAASSGNEENDVIAGLVAAEDGDKPFTYNKAFGVNANSSNKALAWEFVKFLSGEEMQSSMEVMGIPVNKKALEEKTKQSIAGMFSEPGAKVVMAAGSVELTAEQQEVFDAYISELNKLSDELNTYYIKDQIINNTVDAITNDFFSGSKTAEEAVSELQNKTSLYLNE